MNSALKTLGCFVTLLAVASIPGGRAAAEEIRPHKMKLGYALREDHPQGLAAKKFTELLAQKSGGKMVLSTYGNNQLGDDKQMIGALQGGVQEFSIQATSPFVGTIKEYGMLDFPFLITSEKQADAVLDGPFGQKLLALGGAKALVPLVFLENGFRHLTNNKRPIARLEDIKGLKIRVMQSPVFIETVQQLGANPTPLAFSELYSALETGTVDGQENPFAIIETSKFAEVQKYLSLTSHVYNSFVLTASKRWWDKLNATEQAIVRAAAIETREYQRKVNRDLNSTYVAELQKRMQINNVPAAELARMRERVRGVAEKFAKEYDPALLKEFYAAVESSAK
jgi:TRAP-type transport system periplasmic protein